MPFVADRRLEDMLDPRAVTVAGRAMTEKGGDHLQRATKERTPISTDPLGGLPRERPRGTLRESIVRGPVRRHTSPIGRGWQVRVYTEDEVGPYVEWNTVPHPIEPIPPGRALRFYSRGAIRFAGRVLHPGTQGHHMFARAAAWLEAEVPHLFTAELARFGHDLTSRVRRVEDLF